MTPLVEPVPPKPLPRKHTPMTNTLPSHSDQRVVNNVMRHEYRTLSEAETAYMKLLKDMGRAFLETCDEIGASREMSLAKTKIEEAVMWAVKHITR